MERYQRLHYNDGDDDALAKTRDKEFRLQFGLYYTGYSQEEY
jgi:hypothetical protein